MIPRPLPITGDRANVLAHIEQFLSILRNNPEQDFVIILADEFGHADGISSVSLPSLLIMAEAILSDLANLAQMQDEPHLASTARACLHALGLAVDPAESVSHVVPVEE